MLQFLGEFVKAEPATKARPARAQVQFLNQQTEWFTVEDLISVGACGCGGDCVILCVWGVMGRGCVCRGYGSTRRLACLGYLSIG